MLVVSDISRDSADNGNKINSREIEGDKYVLENNTYKYSHARNSPDRQTANATR